MGLLKYAALGAVAGGTEKYGELREEERKEGRQLDKESRAEGAQLRSEDRAKTAAGEQAESAEKFKIRAENRLATAKKTQFDYEQAGKITTLSQGQKAFMPDEETGLLKEVAGVDPKPATAGKGSEKALADVDKFFQNNAHKLYGIDDMSSMDSLTRNSVTRTASIASQLTRKYPEIDRNTILLRSQQQVDTDPSVNVDDILRKIEKKKDVFFSLSTKDKEEIKALEAEAATARENLYSNVLPGDKEPGLLTQDAEQKPAEQAAPETTEPVRIKSTGDYNQLQSGQQYYDPNGVLRVKK